MIFLQCKPLKTLQSKREGFQLTKDQNCAIGYLSKFQVDVSIPASSLSSTGTSTFDPNLIYSCTDWANWLSSAKWEWICCFYCNATSAERSLTVWLPREIFLGCLDGDWHPNSATGVEREGKNKRVFSGVSCLVIDTTVMFYLWCAIILLEGIEIFSVCLVWHKENQGWSFSFSCLPGRVAVRPQAAIWAVLCGVDKLPSAITCQAGWLYVLARSSVELGLAQHCSCCGTMPLKAGLGMPGWVALSPKEHPYLACAGNPWKCLLKCLNPGSLGGPDLLYF